MATPVKKNPLIGFALHHLHLIFEHFNSIEQELSGLMHDATHDLHYGDADLTCTKINQAYQQFLLSKINAIFAIRYTKIMVFLGVNELVLEWEQQWLKLSQAYFSPEHRQSEGEAVDPLQFLVLASNVLQTGRRIAREGKHRLDLLEEYDGNLPDLMLVLDRRRDNRIDCIREIRCITGWSIKSAKDFVDSNGTQLPPGVTRESLVGFTIGT